MINTNIFRAIAIAACAASTAACGNDESQPTNEPGAEERAEEVAAATGDVLEEAGEAAVEGIEAVVENVGAAIEKELDDINALGLTVRNLLNEDVRTPGGGVAAKIEDILFDEEGNPALFQLREGGIFGAGDDLVMVVPQRLVITTLSNNELSVEVSLSEAELEKLGESTAFLPADFSVGGNIETDLISSRKLLASVVYNSEGEKVADIYDLLLGVEWNIEHVVVSRGGLGEVGDRLTSAPLSSFVMTEDRSALRTTLLAPDFDALPTFSYETFVE